MIFLSEAKIQHIEVTENVVVHRKTGTGINEGNIICINSDIGLVFIDAGRVAQDAKNSVRRWKRNTIKKLSILF